MTQPTPSEAGAQRLRTPIQRLSSGQVARRTIRVGAVRRLLMIGAAVVALGLVGSVVFTAMQPTPSIPEAQVSDGSLVIKDPRFVGRAESGERVVVTAESAVRQVGDSNGPVTLISPRLQADGATTATALEGVWSPLTQRLDMTGNVEFRLADGQVATASTAVWEPEAGGSSSISMGDGVRIVRADGDIIEGRSAIWSNARGTLALDGNVSLRRTTGDTASANSARWDARRRVLTLSGSARLATGDVQASSATAVLDYPAQSVTGTGGIQLVGGIGTVTAERYEYSLATRRLRLTGRVRGTLDP